LTKFTGAQQQAIGITEASTRERVIQYLIAQNIYDLLILSCESYMNSVRQLPNFTIDTK